MNYREIEYKTNTASLNSIIEHLNRCADSFNPPLYTYVDINDYGKKIFDNAVTFEAWDGNLLIGLSAAYYNYRERIAFWTNLSLLDEYQHKGIASRLTLYVINYAKKNGFERINLEVKSINARVKAFHKKHGFIITGQHNDCYIMTYFIKKNSVKE